MLNCIILAAGAGTRMKSKRPKVLHEICGIPMIEYVLRASGEAGAANPVVVVGHEAERVQEALSEKKASFAMQSERLGTGHAVMQAMDEIPDEGIVLVLCGDTPLLRGESLKEMIGFHKAEGLSATVLTTILDNPYGYGRIVKNEKDELTEIVEEKDADESQKLIAEINSGMYCFDITSLKAALGDINSDNSQGEYYLTDVIGAMRNRGLRTGSFEISDSFEILGVNNRVQLSEAESILRNRIQERHMLAGVTIVNRADTCIDVDVAIEPDTVILPGTSLKGATVIGENCEIGPHAILDNAIIGAGTTVRQSTVVDSVVGEHTKIGPYAYLRPGSRVGDNVKLGDFVEVKNSNIGNGSKASHLAYIGDADVGQRVNISCGVVFVNYDGKKKHRTVVGDDVFIGCNVNLVAPVTVSDKAYVAAGTTVTEMVPEGALCIGRSRQEVKENWVDRKWAAYNKKTK